MHIRTWSARERLKKQHQAILCLYVDGILVKGSNEYELVKFKESMENEFKMSYLVNFAYFLRLETVEKKAWSFLGLEKICRRHLEEFEDEKLQTYNHSYGDQHQVKGFRT